MTSRQVKVLLRKAAEEHNEKLLDMFECVERMHEILASGSPVVNKPFKSELRAGGPFFSYHSASDAIIRKVAVSAVILRLPQHALACVLTRQPSVPRGNNACGTSDQPPLLSVTDEPFSSCTSWQQHVLHAMAVLMHLMQFAAQYNEFAAHTIAQSRFRQSLIDLATMVFLTIAGPEQPTIVDGCCLHGNFEEAIEYAQLLDAAMEALLSLGHDQDDSGVVRFDKAAQHALVSHDGAGFMLGAMFAACCTMFDAVKSLLRRGSCASTLELICTPLTAALQSLAVLCTQSCIRAAMLDWGPDVATGPLQLLQRAFAVFPPPLLPLASSPCTAADPRLQSAACSFASHGFAELLLAQCLLVAFSALDAPAAHAVTQDLQPPHSARVSRRHSNGKLYNGGLQAVYWTRAAEQSMEFERLLTASTGTVFEVVGQAVVAQLHGTALLLGPGKAQLTTAVLRAAAALSTTCAVELLQPLMPQLVAALSSPQHVFQSRWCAGPAALHMHAADTSDISLPSDSLAAQLTQGFAQKLLSVFGMKAEVDEDWMAQKFIAMKAAVEEVALLFKLIATVWRRSEGAIDMSAGAMKPFLAQLCERCACARSDAAPLHNNLQALVEKAVAVCELVGWDSSSVGRIGHTLLADLRANLPLVDLTNRHITAV